MLDFISAAYNCNTSRDEEIRTAFVWMTNSVPNGHAEQIEVSVNDLVRIIREAEKAIDWIEYGNRQGKGGIA